MLGMSLNTIGALALSQLSFMGLFFLIYHRRQLIGRLIAFYSFCLASHILVTSIAIDAHPALHYVMNRVATLAPATLWLLALYLFVDKPRVPTAIWALMAVYIVLRGMGAAVSSADTPAFEAVYLTSYVMPQFIMLGFCMHAVYLAIQDLGNDLVESRRRVRVPFVIAMGLLVTAILIRGFVSAFQHYADVSGIAVMPMPNEMLFFYIFLIALAFNISSMRLQSDALQIIALAPTQPQRYLKPVPSGAMQPDNSALVNKIFSALRQEKLYTRPGLTIGELAEHLALQEYRLRRVINKQLGYRNFNQFINELRIEEACRRLSLPAQQREQIASIAYDVGYSALSSFNKAFKDIHNITPTQYRDQVQQDDAAQPTRLAL